MAGMPVIYTVEESGLGLGAITVSGRWWLGLGWFGGCSFVASRICSERLGGNVESSKELGR